MTDADRLAKILADRAAYDPSDPADFDWLDGGDFDWLVAEVTRLREVEAEVRSHCDAVWRMDLAATQDSDVRMAKLVGFLDPERETTRPTP